MINPLFLSALALSTTLTPLKAAIERPMDEMKVLELKISKEGLTRISVKSDRIANVYGLSGEFLMEPDEDQGQIFIRPQGPGMTKPFHLTLTTEGGRTQDLRLVPHETTPEAIVLTPQETLPSHSPMTPQMSREEIIDLLKACREGSIPSGYHVRVIDLKEQTDPHLILREIRNDRLIAQTLEVTNPQKEMMYLNPQDYGTAPGTVAVSLSKKVLKPGEKGEIYVIRSAQ